MTDFETAMRNGLRKVFPEAQLKGCWFHYTRAIRRRASKMPDLIPEMRKESSLSKWFKKLLVLPLLSPENIKKAFDLLRDEAQTMNLKSLSMLVVYYQKQWILRVNTYITKRF